MHNVIILWRFYLHNYCVNLTCNQIFYLHSIKKNRMLQNIECMKHKYQWPKNNLMKFIVKKDISLKEFYACYFRDIMKGFTSYCTCKIICIKYFIQSFPFLRSVKTIVPMFNLHLIKFISCFMMGEPRRWGTWSKFRAKFNCSLVLGLSFGDALTLGFYLTFFHHIKTNMGNSLVLGLSFGNAPTLGFYLNFFII